MTAIVYHILFLVQKGYFIPNEKDAKPNQQFGNYSFIDFITENWFSLAAIALMVFFVLFYLKEKKRMAKKEEEEKEKSKWN